MLEGGGGGGGRYTRGMSKFVIEVGGPGGGWLHILQLGAPRWWVATCIAVLLHSMIHENTHSLIVDSLKKKILN